MPLFGSKKDKSGSKKVPPSQAGYPRQGGYPTQPAHPAQEVPGEQPPPYAPPAGAYGNPYGATYGGNYGGAFAPQCGQPNYPMQPNYGYAAQGPPAGHQIPPGTHVVGHGQFDAGARFNSGASVSVPPPPPGCAPNAAQIASMHGGTVHMSQGKAGFFSTSSDGGVSTHID